MKRRRPTTFGKGLAGAGSVKRSAREGRTQYEAASITSLPARVPKAHQTFHATEFLMNLTLPSPIRAVDPARVVARGVLVMAVGGPATAVHPARAPPRLAGAVGRDDGVEDVLAHRPPTPTAPPVVGNRPREEQCIAGPDVGQDLRLLARPEASTRFVACPEWRAASRRIGQRDLRVSARRRPAPRHMAIVFELPSVQSRRPYFVW